MTALARRIMCSPRAALTPAIALAAVLIMNMAVANNATPSLSFTSVDVQGVESLEPETLTDLLKPLGVGKPVDVLQLRKLRAGLLNAYRREGYLAANVRITVSPAGQLNIIVNEGSIGTVSVSGNTLLPDGQILRQISPRLSQPFNIEQIKPALLSVKSHPLIATVNANLSKTPQPGQINLEISVTEEAAVSGSCEIDNHLPKSIGRYSAGCSVTHGSFIGRADKLELSARAGEGLRSASLNWALPLARWELRAGANWLRSNIVEEPFDSLNIENEGKKFSLALFRGPIFTSPRGHSMGLELTHERGSSKLLGIGFSFVPEATDGISKVSALRFHNHWYRADSKRAQSLTISPTLGVSWFGATVNEQSPDSKFLSISMAYNNSRALSLGGRLELQIAAQWADDVLVQQEKFVVGGPSSLRGYPLNSVVGDSGWYTSLGWAMDKSLIPVFGGIPAELRFIGEAARVEQIGDWDTLRSSTGFIVNLFPKSNITVSLSTARALEKLPNTRSWQTYLSGRIRF